MNKQQEMIDAARTLDMISYQIADLTRIKEELEKRLSALCEHSDEGQKSYIIDKYKVVITTGYNYSLDKEEYETIKSLIPDCFNPVKQKVSYELDKAVIRDANKYASESELHLLSQFISKKPKKLHVTVKAAV